MKNIALIILIIVVSAIGISAQTTYNNILHTDRRSKLMNTPVDISPWINVWRSDVKVQSKPESYFLPRVLDRVNNVYRRIYHEHSYEERKAITIIRRIF